MTPTPSRPKARRRPRLGRPAAERVAWNVDTFLCIQRSTLVSIDDIAKAVGVSKHVVYAWQSPSLARTPTKPQLRKLAAVLSSLVGSTIRPADLGKPIDRIRFTFA